MPATIRCALTLAAAMLIALVGLIVPQQAGADPAVPPDIIGDTGGPVLQVVASGNVGESLNYATGNQVWKASDETMSVKVTPGSGSSLPSNWCFDSLFDWERPGTHFDIRIARTCDARYPSSSGAKDDGSGHGMTGANRLATCKGPYNNSIDGGSCVNHAYADADAEGATVRLGNTEDEKCARGWVVEYGGRGPIYYSGGISTDCYE